MPAYTMLIVTLWTTMAGPTPATAKTEINAVLNSWHQAAAKADENVYFSYFTSDAVFLGTDAHERWTRDEFRKWAHPYFARGKAWNFTPKQRHITVSRDGRVAWFDESLATPNLGPARGSGVLVRQAKDWKIAQYNLSVPIPNDLMAKIKTMIEADRKPGQVRKQHRP
jgi:uncharacterized protein (TIGR02246 family)